VLEKPRRLRRLEREGRRGGKKKKYRKKTRREKTRDNAFFSFCGFVLRTCANLQEKAIAHSRSKKNLQRVWSERGKEKKKREERNKKRFFRIDSLFNAASTSRFFAHVVTGVTERPREGLRKREIKKRKTKMRRLPVSSEPGARSSASASPRTERIRREAGKEKGEKGH